MDTVEIQGRSIGFPVEVRRARQWLATYLVPADAAQRLVDPAGLEVAEVPGRKTILSVAFVRYDDGDLDAYDELGVIFLVRPHDAGTASPMSRRTEVPRNRSCVYVHHLPVNQGFTLEAGRTIWGYPKFLADIDIAGDGRRTTCALRHEGSHVLTLSVRDGGIPLPKPKALPTYTFIDGALRKTRWESNLDEVRGRPGGAEITLGTHPIADELRSLGLPKRAFMSSSVGRFRARFGPAEVVRGSIETLKA